MESILNYINGELRPAISGAWLDNEDPSCGAVYSRIAASDAADVDAAVAAAEQAFPAWSALKAEQRAAFLFRMADLMEADLDALAADESRDSGKPLALARRMDIPRAVDNFRFFASAATQFASESHQTSPELFNYTLRQALGVVGCISPWNLPLYLFTWKIAPALAAGCCVVAKPSEVTPMTAFRLAQIAQKAGLPAGVLNILHGTGPEAGSAMVAHPRIKAISFTGGTKTGAAIAATAAPMFKKLSLELGGKNPTIVFSDADFELALNTAVRASFTNQGQICLCGSRILVQDAIYAQFRDAFVAKVQQLKVGNPAHADTDIGALVGKAHFEKVKQYIELAKQEGGTLLCGGEPQQPVPGGYYLSPTVIEGLPQQCRTNMEEIFGPVVTLQSFHDEAEALALANATEYGLAAGLWTSDLNRAHRVAHKLQMGIVWVNCWLERDLRTPFGGVKSSGVGREGGWEAMRFFTEPKNIGVKLILNSEG
jgi:aminomuconate-semialdehyde/2-hydroxymuconate-6-semialdehyde dehydrogenase